MARKKKVTQEFDHMKQKFLFKHGSKRAQTYCTPEQLILKHAVPTKQMKQLLKGEIGITDNGWSIG